MKNSSRLQRIPAPISLSKRSTQAQPDATTPYRMQWGSPLQPIENSSSVGGKVHKSSISNMKEELCNIKTDVEKLLNEQYQETRKNQPSELISKSVRAELEYHKEVEEKLRAEIRELKIKLSEERIVREERDTLAKKIEQIRHEQKAEKIRLKKTNEEAAQKYAQDSAKWQTDYDALLQKFNTLSQQFGDLQMNYTEEKSALNRTIGELERQLSQKNEQFESSLRQRQCKYQSALSEFKKLEVKFDKNTQQSVLTLMHKNMALEQDISNLTNTVEDSKRRCSEMSSRFQRLNQQHEDLKIRNNELQGRLRQPNRQNELQNEIEGLRSSLGYIEASKAQLYTSYLEKCREFDELQENYNTNVTIPTAEIERLKVDNAQFLKMDEILRDQVNHARERIKYLETVMAQKDSYIQALEDYQPTEGTIETIRQLEEKCRQLLHEKMNLVRQYETAIRTLENSMAESRQVSLNQSFSFSMVSRKSNSDFDEALKEQIQENEDLKALAKQRGHEIFELKGEVEQLKRNLQTVKNERELENYRIQTQEKALKSSYDITVQDLKYEVESLKRKYEAIERKLQMKIDEIKKKDDFIQKSIVGRVGKQQNETDVQFLTRQLQKFIQLSLADHIRYV